MTKISELLPEELTPEQLSEAGIEDTAKGLRFVRELAGQGVTDDDLAPLLPLLLDALRGSPDPDRALSSFSRWFAAVSGRYSHLQTLLRHSIALDLFCLVTGCSQYFADLLVRQPECFEIIANPGVRGGTKTAARLAREAASLIGACRLPELKRDALRRWKAREMLRIGVRDLVGLADMPNTAREFSNLADACVQMALDIALATLPLQPSESPPTRAPDTQHPVLPPLAVIAMGKLGGQELNYSSDIDLMFVHGDNLPAEVVLETGRKIEGTAYVRRLAETVVKVLSEESAQGHVFRVDMRLRPEGRFGPLTRSLAGFRAYYDSWAESWERQALIKARVIAGDRELGDAFMALVTPFVYRPRVTVAFLDDIRANKRRIEKKCEVEGETRTNVKTGYGGIRDIEFTAQRMQLEFGGARPRLRTPNTLSALQRLRHDGFLTGAEAQELSDDYQFLRTLEHRLQLLQGFQTQTLPTDPRERFRVARRMGFLDSDAFESELSRRRDRVHAALERLFYREAAPETASPSSAEADRWSELPDLLVISETPAAQERLASLLTDAGFRNIPAALHALRMPIRGNEFGGMPPDTPPKFTAIAPTLMRLLERCPDPDAGLAGIEALALAVPDRAQLYATFADSPEVLEKLVRLSAAAPPLLKRLAQHQEWLETLFSPEEPNPPAPFPTREGGEASTNNEKSPPTSKEQQDSGKSLPVPGRDLGLGDIRQELLQRVRAAKKQEAKLEVIARVYQREILRIGARDVWGEADVPEIMAGLTGLAETVLDVLLLLGTDSVAAAHPEPQFARRVLSRVAVIGLGKLGGAELGYGSDWDVLFVYDEEHQRGEAARSGERFDLVNALVQQTNNSIKALTLHGAQIEMDLRLRPWGRKGALSQTLAGLAQYYRASAEIWERQAALKGRAVAGNLAVGRRCERLLHAVSFGHGLKAEDDAAVKAMKQRIETERLKTAEKETDLKLGHGGLSDIEWLAQRLQLRCGPRRPAVRVSSTLRALSALAALRVLDHAEADVLMMTYQFLTRLRNAHWLQTGSAHDTLPTDPARRRALARLFGYMDEADTSADVRLVEDLTAHRQEVRRIFRRHFLDET